MVKEQKPDWIEKLKMGATGYIKEKYHSPAGKKYLVEKKKKKAKLRGLSPQTKRELSFYSESEQKELLRALGRK